MTSRPQIVLLFGRPGVGKFTVGKALAEELGYRLLHNHAVVDLVLALHPFGSEPFVQLREQLWLTAVESALAAGLPGVILTFAPESTVSDEFLPALEARTRAGGGSLRLVELRCAPGEIERRLGEPSRAAFGKLRDVEQYRELDAAGVFSRPQMPPAELVIDISRMESRQAAQMISKHLSSGRRASGG